MIMFTNVWKIFKKEMLLYVRDKSVIFTNLFIPFIVGPLYLIFVMEVATQMAQKEMPPQDNTVFSISIQGSLSPALKEFLQQDQKIKLSTQEKVLDEQLIVDYRNKFKTYLDKFELENSVTNKLGQAVAQKSAVDLKKMRQQVTSAKAKIEKHFDFKQSDLHLALFELEDGSVASYHFYSAQMPKSRAAYVYLKKLLEDFRQKNLQKQRELNPELAALIPAQMSHWEVDLMEPESKFYLIAGLLVTVSILMVLLTGIYMPTIKTTIGEKDANTYKVLMMTPIAPSEIFLGKLLSVTVQGVVLLIPYTIEYFIIYALGEKSGAFSMLEHFGIWQFLQIGLMILSVVMIAASVCFFACSFAKSTSQAQSLLSLIMFAMLTPLIMILINETQLTKLNALIPMYNFPLMISALLKSPLSIGVFFLCLATNIFTAFAITLLSVNAFTVQWKGRDDSLSFGDLLSRATQKGNELTSSHAIFAFAVVLVGLLISKAFSALQFQFLYYFTFPLVFLLGSSLLVIAYTKIDPFTSIKWKSQDTNQKQLIIPSLICGLGLGLGLTALPTSWWQHSYYNLFDHSSVLGLSACLLLFALLPAICEELIFRGIIMQGLSSQYAHLTSNLLTCMISSLVLIPVYQNLWALFLTFGLNTIYAKRKLVGSLQVNLLVKSLVIIISIKSVSESNWMFSVVGVLCMGIGLWIFRSSLTSKILCPVISLAKNQRRDNAA